MVHPTHRCLHEHPSLVPHVPDDLQGIDWLQDLHLAEGSLHEDEHACAADASTGLGREEDGKRAPLV